MIRVGNGTFALRDLLLLLLLCVEERLLDGPVRGIETTLHRQRILAWANTNRCLKLPDKR
jgi:hypothetical protein